MLCEVREHFTEVVVMVLLGKMVWGVQNTAEALVIGLFALAIIAYHAINAYLVCTLEDEPEDDAPSPTFKRMQDESVTLRFEAVEKEVAEIKTRTALKEGFKL